MNRKDQLLKDAFYEVARNEAQGGQLFCRGYRQIGKVGSGSVWPPCLSAAVLSRPQAALERLNQEARAAMEARDYNKLRATLLELLPLLPGNPRIVYNLACANAKLGDSTAPRWPDLSRLAAMGLVYDLAGRRGLRFSAWNFARSSPRSSDKWPENRKAVTRATLVTVLPGPTSFPKTSPTTGKPAASSSAASGRVSFSPATARSSRKLPGRSWRCA